LVFRHSFGVGNILEAFSQSVGAVAKVYRIRWLFDFGRLTWEDVVVQALSKSSVLTVLQNNLFKVKDMEEATDKFNVRVDVVEDDAVEGVTAATIQERFDSLPPFPGDFSGN
jgi:hypothetical protein